MSLLNVLSILFFISSLIGLMKIFEKAGYKQWMALIPVYNAIIWLKILEKPMWWLIFIFMPFVNVFMMLYMAVLTAVTFSKYLLWEQALAGLFPFLYLPYLGYQKNEVYKKKADRTPFKKTKAREWTDAIIFAVVAASIIRTFIFEAYTIPTPSMEKSLLVGDYLFVSKINYGPKSPNTPIAFPFVHHTLPLSATTKSYLEWIKLPYYRFPGFQKIKNNDIVVFNYPDGDTVALEQQNVSYYQLVRHAEQDFQRQLGNSYVPGMGWDAVHQQLTIKGRPVDKRENYIKRCIATPGDKLQIVDGKVFINDKPNYISGGNQSQYYMLIKNQQFSEEELMNYGISKDDISMYYSTFGNIGYLQMVMPHSTIDSVFSENQLPRLAILMLTDEMASQLSKNPNVEKVVRYIYKKGVADADNDIFPHSPVLYPWNQDNFGPLVIPKAGATVAIDINNLPIYRRIIEVYEGNSLRVEGNSIFINNKPATSYTFKMDYYWMMGDNRHNSADSRFWGFVPEDHIVGKASFVWLSIDKDKGLFSGKIRWNKLFRIPR